MRHAVLEVLFDGHGNTLPVSQLWQPHETAFTHEMIWRRMHLCMIGSQDGPHRLEFRVRGFEPIDDRQPDPRYRVQGILFDDISITPVAIP
jgi:hypothetical protein